MPGKFTVLACLSVALAACTGNDGPLYAQHAEFTVTTVGQFDEPWALEFLPDDRLLISEVGGALKLLNSDGSVGEIAGLPEVSHGGQGGFGDIVLHPDFSENNLIYVSYVERGDDDTSGAAVARAQLQLAEDGGELADLEVIWRQVPKVTGQGHFGHRIVFGPDGYLWISSGERQKFDPSQDMESNLGKIVRLNVDGSIPSDNPFFESGGVTAEIWSLGHRNPLGLAFDESGRLWNIEMGPMGGDELNLVRRGANYGYPIVSNGDHYDGRDIPDHHTRPEFATPAAFWDPVISPSSLMFYSGSEFPDWRGDAFVGGLSSESLVRIEFDGESAHEAQRFDMGRRIRAVEQGPDGAIWVLEGGRPSRGGDGYLLKLTGAPTP
ncbi:MAG: PQQ-dependent sugar dehydrogenase [bacterium]